METEIFTLCDYAQDLSGKLVIVGTFDSIRSKVFPFTYHKNCSIVSRLRFAEEEIGNHSFKIIFINDEEKNIIPPLQGNIQIKKAEVGRHSTINIVLNLNNTKFEHPGRYSIQLYIDNEWKTGLPITLANK